ncbi:MAG: PAS domain S-box protein [Methylotenera sp.]|nr:PAS domain S-box protein [Methylotenera sp.]
MYSYDTSLVFLSVVIAILTSYAALSLSSRILKLSGWVLRYWIFAGSLVMGVGIWAMHFIGMLAFHGPVPLAYDISITISSLLVAVLASYVALYLLQKSIARQWLIVGVFVMGAGVVVMHYVGMAAIKMEPPITYNPVIVGFSVVIAILASGISLWLVSKQTTILLHLDARTRKITSSIIMGAAISGMHYTGMEAAIFHPASVCISGHFSVGQDGLATMVALISIALLILSIVVSHFGIGTNTSRIKTEIQLGSGLFDMMVEGVMITNPDHQILSVNPFFSQITGYLSEEVVGKPSSLIFPEIQNSDASYEPSDSKSGPRYWRGETSGRHKSGRTFPALLSACAIDNKINPQTNHLVIFTDITDRKEAEARQLRAVVDASPITTILTDINGAIIYANTVTEGIFGKSLDELSGKNINTLIPVIVQIDHILGLNTQHIPPIQEFTAIHKNGRKIPVEVTLSLIPMGTQTAVIISINDISERKAKEASLQKSEQSNRIILNTAMDGFCIIDKIGRFLDVNLAYCRMLGYTREEILDMSLRDIEANETPEQTAQHIERITADGYDFFETRHHNKKGTLIAVEISVNYFALGDKFFCFIRDITERRQAEQMRLLEVERQRDTLVREVHHRVKNSLQGMIGLLDLQANEHPELAPLIEDINSRIMSLAIVFGLLGKREQNHVQLCEITSEICKFASQVANVIIDPTVEVKQTQSVLLDKDMAVPIALIVNELITNALKHGKMEDGLHKISVSIDIENHSAILKVCNQCQAIPLGLNFDLDMGLGTGLGLVKAMLPRKGAKLTLIFDKNTMTASLLLTSPVVTILTQ